MNSLIPAARNNLIKGNENDKKVIFLLLQVL